MTRPSGLKSFVVIDRSPKQPGFKQPTPKNSLDDEIAWMMRSPNPIAPATTITKVIAKVNFTLLNLALLEFSSCIPQPNSSRQAICWQPVGKMVLISLPP
jgi:hypothetical protein